MAAAIRKEATV